jgi:Tripartite tricarboxylate transporter family receptor
MSTHRFGRPPSAPRSHEWSRFASIVAPYAAGGATDTIGRVMAERMKSSLGQPVIVENVTGAGGTIAVGRVARAAPAIVLSPTILVHLSTRCARRWAQKGATAALLMLLYSPCLGISDIATHLRFGMTLTQTACRLFASRWGALAWRHIPKHPRPLSAMACRRPLRSESVRADAPHRSERRPARSFPAGRANNAKSVRWSARW